MLQTVRYLIRAISMKTKEKQRSMFGNQFLSLGGTSQEVFLYARVEASFEV